VVDFVRRQSAIQRLWQNIGLDSVGNVYLYGWDSNYTFDLPWVNPLEGRPGSSTGASYPFLATFSPDGSKLLFSTPARQHERCRRE